MTYNEALKLVQSLHRDDQLRLADAILDDARLEKSQPLTQEQAAELDRRLAHLEAHPDDVVPWEEVEAAARARMRR